MKTSRVTLALFLVISVVPTMAQETTRQVTGVAEQSLSTRRATQNELDDWASERVALKQRWDIAQAQVEYLKERVALERERLIALEAAGLELARRLEESRRLESSLEDTLLSIIGRLDQSIARDLPFLIDERTRRLATVRRELGDPAASPADKLRRVLEALLIETRYGGALEVYQDRITVNGDNLTCDMLHVGRLGLFWLTPDEVRGGVWNPATSCFDDLTGNELKSVRRAVQMATRRRAVGVQLLPLGRVGS